MNNRTGNYIPKSRIEKNTTTSVKTMDRDEIKVKKDSTKHPKVTRTQFEEEEYEYAKGGGVRKSLFSNREYSYGRNWTNEHRHHNKSEDYEVPMSDRKRRYANGGSVNMNKHIWEGWTVGSFIDDLEPQFDMINRGQSWQKPFATREEVKRWAMDNQPYYKKYIPEVVDYFWSKSQNKNNYYVNGGSVDAEQQAKIDGIEEFINNPENQKNDPATVERFKGILANIKAKIKETAKAEPKVTAPAEPKATAPVKPRATAPAKPRVTAPAKPKATAPVKSKSEDVAENLMEVYDDALDGLKVESGSEVYGSIDIQKELKKILDKKITEKSFSKEVGDVLTDENYHSLKNYLALSGLLGKTTENEYLGNFKKYKGKGFWNPSVFGFEVEKEKVAPAKVKAEPKEKTTTPTETKTTKVKSPSMVTVEGKEMDMESAEFCDYLLKKFKDRREKSKNAPKKKTPSVMAKITSNVEKSVVQAIKSSVESNKKAIEKNPDFFVKKVEKLESSTKSFLQSMKDVLGDDFKEGEIASTMKHIEELTESLIAKYKTK